jgi:fructose-1,6-bisphosphatase I
MTSSTTSPASQVPLTLITHILKEFHGKKEQTDLAIVLSAIAQACKTISAAIRQAPLINIVGMAGYKNSMGEEVKKLDVLSNDNFISALTVCGKVCAMASEENGEIIQVPEGGDYVVCFDPLDGSSNIDVAVPVGSIFAIYKRISKSGEPATMEDVLQPGTNMICAGYAMYGSCTMLILATQHGVNGFTLDPVSGEFILSNKQMKVPQKGTIYSVNEGNAASWQEPTRNYVTSKKEGKPFSLRYVGSMVADVHRTLLVGGVFMYPADKNSPNGKLRLLYECNPMGFIMEKAGGKASTGTKRILEITPKDIHQRVPIYLGSFDNVSEIEKLHQ